MAIYIVYEGRTIKAVYVYMGHSLGGPPPRMVWFSPPPHCYLQHLEALRLSLHAICCIWEKSSVVWTLFA